MSIPQWSSLDWRTLIEQMVDRWQKSPIRGFYIWWRCELLGCLPESLKRHFKVTEARSKLRWPLPSDGFVRTDQVVSLVLHPAQVLECDVKLPHIPRHALSKVMAHEIDRYTPFNSDEVYFDVRVLGTARNGIIDVRLTVILRSNLDEIVCQAKQMGIEVASVDVLDDQERPQGIDLLPVSAYANQAKRTGAVRTVLLTSILILTCACMSAWVERREQALEVRRVKLVDIRKSSMQVDALRKQLQMHTDIERALHVREAKRLSSIALLDLLTRCVPEQTWLDSLRLDKEGQLVITGTSSRASELPMQMSECAGLLKSELKRDIQPESKSGRKHFTLYARLPASEG